MVERRGSDGEGSVMEGEGVLERGGGEEEGSERGEREEG